MAMRFRELGFQRDPTRPPITGLIDYEEFCGLGPARGAPAAPTTRPEVLNVEPEDLERRLDSGWQPFILDVRAPHEADIVQLPGTDLLRPHSRILEGHIDDIPRDRPVLVYCRSGARSARAAEALASAGIADVANLLGGIRAWVSEVDPTLPSY